MHAIGFHHSPSKNALSIHAFALVVSIAITSVTMASCAADVSSWYPAGKATVVTSRDIAGEGESGCAFTIKVANEGNSIIVAYTISLSASTSLQTYYVTFDDDMVILPGRCAYFDGSIAFVDDEEALLPDGLAIVCDYYR